MDQGTPTHDERQFTWLIIDRKLSLVKPYSYADILRDGVIQFKVEASDDKGYNYAQILEPLEPVYDPENCVDLPTIKCELEPGKPVSIKMRHGMIYGSKCNNIYYKGNQRTSGAEIRLNGRAITRGLLERIWGETAHNCHNHFLAQINVISDLAGALPSTMNTKTAFCEGDPRFEKLVSVINTHIKAPTAEQGNLEHQMVLRLQEQKKGEPGIYRCDLEEPVFKSEGIHLPMDLYVAYEDWSVVYESKAGYSKPKDFAQLRLYVDGCSIDGKACDEAILIAEKHPNSVQKLVALYNKLSGPTGTPYNFRLVTWEEAGIKKPVREV